MSLLRLLAGHATGAVILAGATPAKAAFGWVAQVGEQCVNKTLTTAVQVSPHPIPTGYPA